MIFSATVKVPKGGRKLDNEKSNVDKAEAIGNYLNLYFNQDEGVRLGESTVVSRKAHARMPEKRLKGQIKILINQDAGQHYLDFVEKNQVVHIDVYYKLGAVCAESIARCIYKAMEEYFLLRDPSLQFAADELTKIALEYCHKIYISTNQGQGTLYDLLRKNTAPSGEGGDHVHVLARLLPRDYYLIYVMAEAVEDQINSAGMQAAKVRNIEHGRQRQPEEDFAHYIKLPWKKFKGANYVSLPDKENISQLVLKLAEKFGGVDEINEFLDNYSTNIFKRKGMDQQKKKWGDTEHVAAQLEELDIFKDTVAGRILTRKGDSLKKYVLIHQCELETEIRRNIRRAPSGGAGRFKRASRNKNEFSHLEFTNRKKTKNDPDKKLSGELAVPQTVIQSKKNTFFRREKNLVIHREDLHYYAKKNYIPVDICLLIDSSGSMAGEKRLAACYLAEHLLLTGKEKVAVVVFQERGSRVATRFTRKQSALRQGLATINPAGLTPLANGIVNAVELIKQSRVRNPLLVLITDGIPNAPLWTNDAKADALKAAAEIVGSNIRFICIGVDANKQYLEKLADRGSGLLYTVDDLNKDNLINIVRSEKRSVYNTAQQQ